MEVLVNPQSWTLAAIGGAMIGIAAVLMYGLIGRIAGISGIFGGLLFSRDASDAPWRILFLVGLIGGAFIVGLAQPQMVSAAMQVSLPGMIVAGLIVGVGTRLGSGCTSGHGVCGIARLSRRSLIATVTFMTGGFVTVFLVRHLLGG
ncbi:MAG: YeeE/YedE family protein [Panacagrimonas sp.]